MLVHQKAEEIVQRWIDYFVLHKKVDFERINEKLS